MSEDFGRQIVQILPLLGVTNVELVKPVASIPVGERELTEKLINQVRSINKPCYSNVNDHTIIFIPTDTKENVVLEFTSLLHTENTGKEGYSKLTVSTGQGDSKAINLSLTSDKSYELTKGTGIQIEFIRFKYFVINTEFGVFILPYDRNEEYLIYHFNDGSFQLNYERIINKLEYKRDLINEDNRGYYHYLN